MGFTIQDNEKKLIFPASTRCVQGSILKLLSVLLWGARWHFNEDVCHLSKWCSHFCSSHSQRWCQDKGPSADSHAMPWHVTRVANLLHKAPGKSLPERKAWPKVCLVTGWVPPSLDHGRRCPRCQTSGLAHCLIFPLTQVSYRIFSWNKNLELSQGELSPKCLKWDHFLKLC